MREGWILERKWEIRLDNICDCFKGFFQLDLSLERDETNMRMVWVECKGARRVGGTKIHARQQRSSDIVTVGRRRASRWPRLPSIWCRVPSKPPFSAPPCCLSPTFISLVQPPFWLLGSCHSNIRSSPLHRNECIPTSPLSSSSFSPNLSSGLFYSLRFSLHRR